MTFMTNLIIKKINKKQRKKRKKNKLIKKVKNVIQINTKMLKINKIMLKKKVDKNQK